MALASAPPGANTSSRELIDANPDAARFAGAVRTHGDGAELEPFAEAAARGGGRALIGRCSLALLRHLDLHPVACHARDDFEAARELLYHGNFLRHHARRRLDVLPLAQR